MVERITLATALLALACGSGGGSGGGAGSGGTAGGGGGGVGGQAGPPANPPKLEGGSWKIEDVVPEEYGITHSFVGIDGDGTTFVAYSKPGGIYIADDSSGAFESALFKPASHPRLWSDKDGTLHLTYGDDGDIRYQKRAGSGWSEPVDVTGSGMPGPDDNLGWHELCVNDNGYIGVAFRKSDPLLQKTEIHGVRLKNGQPLGPPQLLLEAAGDFRVSIDSEGVLHVVAWSNTAKQLQYASSSAPGMVDVGATQYVMSPQIVARADGVHVFFRHSTDYEDIVFHAARVGQAFTAPSPWVEAFGKPTWIEDAREDSFGRILFMLTQSGVQFGHVEGVVTPNPPLQQAASAGAGRRIGIDPRNGWPTLVYEFSTDGPIGDDPGLRIARYTPPE